ncbi:MAG TPA: hypothetical protein VEW48_07165 [Thermoanaerobaculia bacterium]|nr:hypothetical protein [Thermoanaerobaculia bacterium]
MFRISWRFGPTTSSGMQAPPVEVQGGKLLRRVLAAVLHLRVDDLRLGGQVAEDEPVGGTEDAMEYKIECGRDPLRPFSF